MIREGLKILPKDERDFKHHVVFRTGALTLPTEFCLDGLTVKDQGDTDFCSAFATSTANGSQYPADLCPEYAFAKGKEISGDPDAYGQELRTACKAHINYGCILASINPFPFETTLRSTIADWTKWNPSLDISAILYRQGSFFSVNPTLADIKQAIYQQKSPVVTGMSFRQSWIMAPGGVIPETYEDGGSGHAFLFKGVKIINGKEYLIAHLSNGTNIGDNGIFYFSDAVVQKEATFGNFVFTPLPKDSAQYYNNNKISVYQSWLSQMLTILKNMLNELNARFTK